MPFSVDDTCGPAFVGMVVAAMLHGVSCVQALHYFTNQNDSWPIKLLVSTVLCVDTIHQTIISHAIYTYTITDWGKPAEFEKLVWSMLVCIAKVSLFLHFSMPVQKVETLFTGFTALLVQSFLMIRVWRLTSRLRHIRSLANKGRIALTSVVGVLVIGQFVTILVNTVLAFHFTSAAKLREIKGLPTIITSALATIVDILIAAPLCINLHRSRTGFQRSDTMIKKLILFSVSTGLLTSLCAVAALVSVLAVQMSTLNVAFFFCIGRLYTNSLLATLNSRNCVQSAREGSQNTCKNACDFPRAGPTSAMHPNTTVSVKIETTRQDDELDFEKSGDFGYSEHPKSLNTD